MSKLRATQFILRKRAYVITGLVVMLGYGAWGSFAPLAGYPVEGKYFDSAGVRLHYTDQGVGEPLILLHGFAMNGDLTWRRSGTLDALAEHYRVIALDCRGHGYSDKPHDPDAYGLKLTDDIIRLMDHLKIEKAHFAGHSLGGMIGFKAVSRYPERFQSAVISGFGWAMKEERTPVAQALAKALMDGGGFDVLLETLRPGGKEPDWMTIAAANAFVGYLNDETALAMLADSMPELAVPEAYVRENEVPIFFTIGDLDPLMVDVDRVNGIMPNHECNIVEGADHFRVARFPAYREGILSFLAKHPMAEATGEDRADRAVVATGS